MNDIEKRIDAMKAMIPKEGFSVVGVDDFDDAGDDLYLVGHYATETEANAVLAEMQKESTDDFYVYSSKLAGA